MGRESRGKKQTNQLNTNNGSKVGNEGQKKPRMRHTEKKSKITALSPFLSVITLNVNGLNTYQNTKISRMRKKKHDSTMCCLQDVQIHKYLESEIMKKYFPCKQ